MRKFTKEIATLLAAVSVSASANMASAPAENANAASNNSTSMSVLDSTIGTVVSTAATTAKVTTRVAAVPGSTLPPDEGVAMPPDEDVTFPPDEGVQMIPDEYTTTTRATTTTTIGTQTSKLTTTTTTTTTTTVGTEVSKLTTTTTTTTIPPLMGTIVSTQPVSTTPAISTTPVMSPGEDIELYTEDLNVGTETDDNGETYTYFEFDPNNADFVTFCFTKKGDTIPFTFNLIIPTPYGPVVKEYPEYISGGELQIGITVPAAYHGGIIRAEYYDSRVNIEKVVFSKFEDPDTTIPPLEGDMMPSDEETTTTTTVPPLAGKPLPPDEYITTTTTVPPLAGVPLPPDEYTTTTIPPLMGTEMPTSTTTTQTYIAGGMMPSDEETTTTTTTIPPLMGTEMPTTVTTTIPPMMGDMQIRIYGDANNDSAVSIADAAAILQYIANPDKYGLSEKGMIAADVVGNGNGITVDDAIAIQKLDAKIIDDFSELE